MIKKFRYCEIRYNEIRYNEIRYSETLGLSPWLRAKP